MKTVLDFQVILPVLILCAYALLVLILSPALRRSGGTAAGIAGLGLLVSGYSCIRLWGSRGYTAYQMVQVDEFSIFFSLLFLLVGLLAILASSRYLERQGANHGEYYALLLLSIAGMMTMASSENLLVIFIGLELLSIPLYILSGLTRTRARSVEAALKYFLLGAFSTGFIVYGLAFIYGASGSLNLPLIATGADSPRTLVLGMGLLLVGFAFKIAAVPFHFWAPDVYQGAPTTLTGFMAAGTKAAAFAALVRVLGTGFATPSLVAKWVGLLTVISILTMTVANLIALTQTNIKRMLAYSSIAHAGYLLIAVVTMGTGIRAAGSAGAGLADDAVQVIGFYLVSYALMTLGAFGIAALIGRAGESPEDGPGGEAGYSLAAYAGLGRRRPLLAAAMLVFMISLAGLPPTAGFFAKFYLFRSAIDAGLITLAVIGVLNAVVAAAYYLKVVVAMYFKEAATEPARAASGFYASVALTIAVAGTLYLGLFPGRLLQVAHQLYGAIR